MEIIYFSAPWCGPCVQFRPLLYRVLEDFPHIKVRQVNIDDELKLAFDNNITSIPTLVGPKKMRLTGAASEDVLRQWLSAVV